MGASMKFGGKHTVQSRASAVESRYGKTTGASKGSKPAPAPKIKPTGNLKKPGVKVTWNF